MNTKTNDAFFKAYEKPLNYDRVAKMWSIILEKETKPSDVALCLHQMYISRICCDDENDSHSILKASETLFMFEGLKNKKD